MEGTTVELLGAEANALQFGWVDLSVSTSNTLIDHHFGEQRYGRRPGTYSPSTEIDGIHIGQKSAAYKTAIDFTVSYADANFHIIGIDKNRAWTRILDGVLGPNSPLSSNRVPREAPQSPTRPACTGKGRPPVLPLSSGTEACVRMTFDGEDWVEL